MPELRRARGVDLPIIADTLAEAFADDPMFRWGLGSSGSIEQRLRIFFRSFIAPSLRRAEHLVFASHDAAVVAVWEPVGAWKVSPVDLVRMAPGILRSFRHRTPVMIGALSKMEASHPRDDHYYLAFLGTRRGSQGRGLGSAALADMLDRCDTEGVPAYLESSNPVNIPFYARHGFKIRDELALGKDAPTCTTMWRDPKSG